MKIASANKIVNELIDRKKWRSHGRSIKISDLHDIGLKIDRIDDDPDLAEIVYRIQTVIRLLYSSTSTYKIFATSEEKIFKQASMTGSIIQKIPIGAPEVVNFEIRCSKCSEVYNLYAKFIPNPQIDKDFSKKGFIGFPSNNMLKCNKCGYEFNLTGLRNNIETKAGKKIVNSVGG